VKSILKKLRYRLEWLLVVGAKRIIPLLPRPALLALSRGLGGLAYLVDRRGRTTALQNLRAAFTAGEMPDAELRKTARASYRHFAQSMCDLFWGQRLTRENFSKFARFEFEDDEAVAAARKPGAIWVTPHYCNFEWIALCMGFRDYPFCIVAENFKNPLLTSLFTQCREHSGHTIIPQERAMIRLLKHLKNGGHAAFLPDLTVRPGNAATAIDCFGLTTSVTVLHAMLAQRTGLPIIPGVCLPQEDGTYLLKGFRPLDISAGATTQQIAQACWKVFEPTIRSAPAPWLWMYKHWRYRPRDPAEGLRYPAYANHAKAFDKLCADAPAAAASKD
jgi:KDO2-lipid IV(A) lauroyltransferase